MKAEDLALIARTMTPVVREFVAQQNQALLTHIAVLEQRLVAAEQRAMTPGPVGPAGDVGPSGPQGPQGPAGTPGTDGAQGPQGDVGPAGERGTDGASGTDGAPGPQGEKGEAGPQGEKGLDGLHGKDGQDGITMGVDDLQAVEYDGEHTVTLKFRQGDRTKDFPIRFANVLDRGVYDAGKAYTPGDAVTLGGSLWIAKADTNTRPGTTDGASAWRLAVKAGRDGKEGKQGPEGKPGPRGEKGTDGRNGYN